MVLQVIPIETEQIGGKLPVAGIGGSRGDFESKLLDNLLDALGPIASRKLVDERLKIFFGERGRDRRPAADEMAGIISQNSLAADGGYRGEVDLRSNYGGQ